LKKKQAEQIDFLSFQRREITEASVKPGEDAELESFRRRLKNAEFLQEAVGKSIEELYSAPGSVIEQLGNIGKNLAKACRLDQVLSSKAEAVSAAAYNIEDITSELRAYLLKIETDGKELESVEARLDLLNKLKRKYGGSIEAVLEKLESIEKELSGIENLSERIAETEKRLAGLHKKLATVAKELSAKRQECAKQLALKVEKELATLKMSRTKFEVSVEAVKANEGADPFLVIDGNQAGETGVDRAEFLIAPNVGEELKPLSAIASGGELSRVVLALKALLAGSGSVETVVFDEVDAGIGGGVAEVVGRKMASLAGHHQIICITHLPQIARFGDNHFRISKHVEGGRTKTVISPLAAKERVEELARMLGGEEITRATIAHAREMLESR
jgi:DNA repair protein RecN (Recombination protein N)